MMLKNLESKMKKFKDKINETMKEVLECCYE